MNHSDHVYFGIIVVNEFDNDYFLLISGDIIQSKDLNMCHLGICSVNIFKKFSEILQMIHHFSCLKSLPKHPN